MSIQSLPQTPTPLGSPQQPGQDLNAAPQTASAAPEQTARNPLAGRVIRHVAHYSFLAAKLTGQGLYKLGQGIAYVAGKFAQLVKALHDEYKAHGAGRAAQQPPRSLQQRRATQPSPEKLDLPHASAGRKLREMTLPGPKSPALHRSTGGQSKPHESSAGGLHLTGYRNTNPEDLKFIAEAEKRRAALSRPDDPKQAAARDALAQLNDQAWIEHVTQRLDALKKPD
jgi:hypothetical protein